MGFSEPRSHIARASALRLLVEAAVCLAGFPLESPRSKAMMKTHWLPLQRMFPEALRAQAMSKRRTETLLRLLSGSLALGIVLVALRWMPVWGLQLLCAAMVVGSTRECARLLRAAAQRERGRQARSPAQGVCLLLAAGVAGSAFLNGAAGLHLGFTSALIFSLSFVWPPRTGAWREGLSCSAEAIFCAAALPWLLSHFILLAGAPQGRLWLFLLLCCVSANDSLAWTVGQLLGRHRLWPQVSAGKTIAGSLGGLGGGLLGGWGVGLLASTTGTAGWAGVSALGFAGVGVSLAFAAQAGDLLVSAWKRQAGVKDSGRFLPGHGGLLDRVDAYLLAAPILYAIQRGLAP